MSNKSSPAAARAASFLSDGRYTGSLTQPIFVAKLPQKVEQHKLRTQAPSGSSDGVSPLRDPEHSLRSGATITNTHSGLVCQRRKPLSHHQYTSAHLSGETECYTTHHSSSNDIQPSHDITPSSPLHDSTAYFAIAPPSSSSSSSTADDSGYDSASDAPPGASVSRTNRRNRQNKSARDSPASSLSCVMKPIRMRKREQMGSPDGAHQQ
ncbi:MAG: hypothetical protein FRX48_00251 [Lasallia pustulata]|uniref:Uncharacterized protein n=1 Tax=Lasallia pustulata TaxID=136370 RepID=A0A5M8Q2U8_9LECA|nr:MAG: hypothetical protein FRX48_00251 [Lasallia pustulata]